MVSTETLLVKKYGNRRLYDTERSIYINLDDLAALLKAGRDIKVVDARTGSDLTRAVFLQVILEREKDNIESLPVELLKELIVAQDSSAKRWFDLSMRLGLESVRRLKAGSVETKGLGWPDLNPMAVWEQVAGNLMDPWLKRAPQAPRESPVDGTSETQDVLEPGDLPEVKQVRNELEELKERLEQLEKSVRGGGK